MAQFFECDVKGEHDENSLPPFPKDLDLKFGDVISFNNSSGRKICFVGENKTLIDHPNINVFRYLTVPIQVTQYFGNNAYTHYQNIIDRFRTFTIVLQPNDKWLVEKYGEELPPNWKIQINHASNGKNLNILIEFENGKYRYFGEDISLKSIKNFHSKIFEQFHKISVRQIINSANEMGKWIDYDKNTHLKLPESWVGGFLSSCSGSKKGEQIIEYNYHGPETDMGEAETSLKNYWYGWKDDIELIKEKLDF